MKKRKSFQDLPGEENPHFLENGKGLYLALKEKYPNENCEDLDTILNSLCCALICLTKVSVPPDERKGFLQLIYKILDKNL